MQTTALLKKDLTLVPVKKRSAEPSLDNKKIKRGKITSDVHAEDYVAVPASSHTLEDEYLSMKALNDFAKNVVPGGKQEDVAVAFGFTSRKYTDLLNMKTAPYTKDFKKKFIAGIEKLAIAHEDANTHLDNLKKWQDIEWQKNVAGMQNLMQLDRSAKNSFFIAPTYSLKTPIPYTGCKGYELCLAIINNCWPKDIDGNPKIIDTLIEACAGSAQFSIVAANFGLAKNIIINDIDPRVSALHAFIKRDPNKLIQLFSERSRLLYQPIASIDAAFLANETVNKIADKIKILVVMIKNTVRELQEKNTKQTDKQRYQEIKASKFETAEDNHPALHTDAFLNYLRTILMPLTLAYANTDEINHRIWSSNTFDEAFIKKIMASLWRDVTKYVVLDKIEDAGLIAQGVLTLAIRKLLFKFFNTLTNETPEINDHTVATYYFLIANSFANKGTKILAVNTLPVHDVEKKIQADVANIPFYSMLLNKHNVVINNLDYKTLIDNSPSENTLIFIDPPYFGNDIASDHLYAFNHIDGDSFQENIEAWKKNRSMIITVGKNGLRSSFKQQYCEISSCESGLTRKTEPPKTCIYAGIYNEAFKNDAVLRRLFYYPQPVLFGKPPGPVITENIKKLSINQ